MSDNTDTFGDILTRLIAASGWTAWELSSRSGVTAANLYHAINRPGGWPRFHVADRLARALSVSLDVLAGRQVATTPTVCDQPPRRSGETFGGCLERMRAVAGLSVQQLAEAAGISRQALHNALVGKVTPTLLVAARIADALGVPLDAMADPDLQIPGEAGIGSRGRPRKERVEEVGPKRPVGRPRKRQEEK